jgi:dipeptidyl aminopeptidase/acylaminoacyl peptidase
MKFSSFLSSSIFILSAILFSPSAYSIDLKEGESFAFEPIDYTKTPIYKEIKKHPEDYTYLDSVTIYRILYLSEGLKITGLMAAPKSDGKFPVVLYNRGGNREYGSLLVSAATDILAPIAAEGYVVLATNYRGNSGSEGAEEFGGSDVMDVVNLAKTCSAFSKADNSKIALFGVSRGGMMNYLVLRKMHEFGLNIKCAIQIGGIVNLEKTIEYHPEIGAVCEEIIPNYNGNKLAEHQKRSAIFWTNELPDSCPILILHSYDDAAATYTQIPAFADSLDKYNKPYQLISYKNDNHGIMKHRDHVQQQLNLWLSTYLQDEEKFVGKSKRIVVE